MYCFLLCIQSILNPKTDAVKVIFDKKGIKGNYLAEILGVDENHIKFKNSHKNSFFDLILIVGKDHSKLKSYDEVMQHYGLVN